MAEPEPSLKPNPKAIVSDLYKEIAKWLFDLAKPLLTTAGMALGLFIAGKSATFGSFLTADLTLTRCKLLLWMLLGAIVGMLMASLLVIRKTKQRENQANNLFREQLADAEERIEKAEALANAKIADLEKRALSAENIAAHDKLTGLFNLRELEARIRREAVEAFENKRPFSMILLDIDNFGEKNLKYGYEAGDAILKQFAHDLIEGSRRKDPIFRYRSGDEFAILALNQDKDAAKAFAKRIVNETKISTFQVRDMKKDKQSVSITISAGIAEAVFPLVGSPDYEQVIRDLESQAEAALKEAKKLKNLAVVFEPESF